jgi:hypothetical protein
MTINHLFAALNQVGLNTLHFIAQFWLPILIISLSTLILILARARRNSASHSVNNQQPLKNFTDVYDRIHNFQSHQTSKTTSSTATPSSTPSPHHNSTTDSHYHHAIKLLQRGIETKTLVEYCNLTLGEAELLQELYGKTPLKN